MDPHASAVLRWRKPVYIVLGILGLAMFIMSLVQVWVLLTVEDPSGFGAVQADSEGMPATDQRGAYLMLKPDHDPAFPSGLIKLLTTTQAGVIDPTVGAHVTPADLDAVLLESSNISTEVSDYRLYIIADQVEYPMKYDRATGGKSLQIRPASGVWRPGAYQLDVPSDGMFGGRDYYQFYVDAAE
ncbi:MAG TPA: hypothetical protein VFH60_13100 [Chloroflexia bacterium]|nr:hypothetical protein [Chloroflexia bacterium]